MKSRKLVDSVRIFVRGGRGGNGCLSFRREAGVPYGGPDGGDGGCGGDVILVGTRNDNSLERLFFSPHLRAGDGGHGRGQKANGRDGAPCLTPVPCGTEVWTTETDEMIGDIVEHGQQLVVARGGRGGLGNCHWKTATHQAPREHTPGEPGEEFTLRLELKLMADVGLVGFPNAGKSLLLSRISDAHPRVAPYPFTTLNPIIGTVIFDDYSRITVADVPGLVKNAHRGVGLGVRFLQHIERATALVYVIDMAGVDQRDPAEDYFVLRNEIEQYRAELLTRPRIVVANKMDLPDAAANLTKFRKATRTRPLTLSAETGKGLPELLAALHKLFPRSETRPARMRTRKP